MKFMRYNIIYVVCVLFSMEYMSKKNEKNTALYFTQCQTFFGIRVVEKINIYNTDTVFTSFY